MLGILKEIWFSIKTWIQNHLRTLCGKIPPDRRYIVVLAMLILFASGSIYTIVSSVYDISKGKGEKLNIEHIKSLELEQHQKADSINQLKNRYYEYE